MNSLRLGTLRATLYYGTASPMSDSDTRPIYLQLRDKIAAAIIERAGHRPAALAEIVTAELKGLPTVSASDPKPPPATGPLMQVISGAEQLAGSMGDRYVAVEHLLLALAESVEVPVIISGGVASLADIEGALARRESGIAGAILGRSLYTGAVDLSAALQLVEEAEAACS